jgi:3-deoxy-7-phosphoheptulonate synthase
VLHIILRGGKDGPNYDAANIADVKARLMKRLVKGRIVVDCSHGNSSKDYRNQALALKSVVEQILSGEKLICGVMLESNIHEGNQKHDVKNGKNGLEYGKSVTDACIGFEETELLLKMLCEKLKS